MAKCGAREPKDGGASSVSPAAEGSQRNPHEVRRGWMRILEDGSARGRVESWQFGHPQSSL